MTPVADPACRFAKADPEHVCHRRDGVLLTGTNGDCWAEARTQATECDGVAALGRLLNRYTSAEQGLPEHVTDEQGRRVAAIILAAEAANATRAAS